MKALLLLAVLSPVQQEPQRTPLFRAATKRVYVDVFVSRDGRPVSGLEADDFVVVDNETRQKNLTLLDAADEPLSAVLLMDTSGSVRGSKLQQLKQAANTFITGLSSVDEIGVISFGTRFRLIQPLTAARQDAIDAIDAIRSEGATALHDGIQAASVHAETGSGRPLVVVFSDGADNSSWLSTEDVVSTAESSPAVIYTVRVTSRAGLRLGRPGSGLSVFVEPAVTQQGKRVLEEVAHASGGRDILIESTDTLSRAFVEILDEMRSRYLLFYEPDTTEPGWHSLSVTLKKGDKRKVRARSGYFFR